MSPQRALLRGLHALSGETGIEPVVAHLDHGLRPDSAADAEWVVELADGLDSRKSLLDTVDRFRNSADVAANSKAAQRSKFQEKAFELLGLNRACTQ